MKNRKGNFQLSGIEIAKYQVAVTQSNIAYGVLALSALFLIMSAIYGIWKGDFSEVKIVLLYVQSPVSFIMGFYFSNQTVDITKN